MKISHVCRGFTLMEMLIVISIMALLAALLLGGGNRVSSRRHVTQGYMLGIEAALERYHTLNGEYPEPVNADETAELMPGKVYRIGAAKCLYQALSGDGSDAIKGNGLAKDANPSNGNISTDEIKNSMFTELPQALWRKIGSSYILVDAFGHPFQYTKADNDKKNTINSSYDLWSYAEDDKNTIAKSKDTEAAAGLGAKWIKNW